MALMTDLTDMFSELVEKALRMLHVRLKKSKMTMHFVRKDGTTAVDEFCALSENCTVYRMDHMRENVTFSVDLKSSKQVRSIWLDIIPYLRFVYVVYRTACKNLNVIRGRQARG